MSNMVVNTNVLALNSHRALKGVGNSQSKASARLSSGMKINSAADDAAGLAISEKMRAQIRGLDMASKNSQDAISLIQTAEGGMQEIDNMIQRIRELTVQVSNDTNENNELGTGDRQKIQDEIDQLVAEIDSMAGRVEFNKKRIIDGSFADTKAQLVDAKTELDATKVTKVATDATIKALTTALSNAKTSLTGTQTLLDGGAAAYSTAVGIYKAAGVTYTQAQDEHNAALAALNTLLDETGVNNLASFTADMFDASKEAYLGADNIQKLKDATVRYAAAAIAYGFDGLDMQTQLTNPTAISSLGVTIPTAANANNDASKRPLLGAQLTWDGAKSAFATAQSTYDTLVRNRDVDQQKVTSLTAQIDEALKASRNANASNSAASIKYTAAKDASENRATKALHFQVGANAAQSLIMSIGSVKSDFLGIGNGKGITTIDVVKDSGVNITATLDVLDTALSYVTTQRSKLGAAQNRLEYTIASLDISSENLSAAESRIRDTDMAKEMMALTRSNVLQQAATSMLAQANQAPQNVLQLLQ